MKKSMLRLPVMLLFITPFLASCASLVSSTPTQQPNPDSIFTAAAQTVFVQQTLSVGQTAVAQLTQIARTSPTPTPVILTATQAPQVEPEEPILTQVPPTATPEILPEVTENPIPCDWGEYVRNVTVEDDTIFPPGATFIKTWRLRNIGSCTWNRTYSLIFSGGNPMGDEVATSLAGVVNPGETVDVSVRMIAPNRPGTYRGEWFLRNGLGRLFGIGIDAGDPIWVQIRVAEPPQNNNYAYDFATNYCSANWNSRAGRLSCPGYESEFGGNVLLLNRPALEQGRTEDELTLWTLPDEDDNGWISGVYPAYRVNDGDHFLADVGCLEDSEGCDVTFTVEYQLQGGDVYHMGSWREVYDGEITRIDLDLSFLAGHWSQFILSVYNNGPPAQANAFWLAPSIRAIPPGENVPAAQAARQALARDLGLNMSVVTIQRVEVTQWADSCLGVHIPGQTCTPLTIPGYRVILNANNRRYEAHTNQDGSTVFWFET